MMYYLTRYTNDHIITNELIMDVLAYFIPGYHKDEFNDKWWGNGFTEWVNIEKSKPLYDGHIQPNKPMNGYYNLISDGVLESSYKLANQYGIDAFIVYDYWYNGKRPLGKILDQILSNKTLAFKFCLCWANHSWTRSWTNRSGVYDVLIRDVYSTGSELSQQINYYVEVFKDKRYYKVNGQPLFQIYRPDAIPNLDEFIKTLTNECINQGIKKPFLVFNFNGSAKSLKLHHQCDAFVISNPTLAMNYDSTVFNNYNLINFRKLLDVRSYPNWIKKILFRVQDILPDKHTVYDYDYLNKKILEQSRSGVNSMGTKLILSCFTGFDNTPRYKRRATIVKNNNSKIFLETMIQLYKLNPGAPYLAVNAWNEWGEGMTLEPSEVHGLEYLEAVSSFKKYLVRYI